MMEWKPIQTAPDDGTFILVYDAAAHKRWPKDIEEFMHIANYIDWQGWTIQLDGQRCFPTHWMPLPAPPVQASEKP